MTYVCVRRELGTRCLNDVSYETAHSLPFQKTARSPLDRQHSHPMNDSSFIQYHLTDSTFYIPWPTALLDPLTDSAFIHWCQERAFLPLWPTALLYPLTDSTFISLDRQHFHPLISGQSTFTLRQTANLPHLALTDTKLLGFSVEHSVLHLWPRTISLVWHVSIYLVWFGQNNYVALIDIERESNSIRLCTIPTDEKSNRCINQVPGTVYDIDCWYSSMYVESFRSVLGISGPKTAGQLPTASLSVRVFC